MTIQEAEHVKIDQNDIREILDVCGEEDCAALNSMLAEGELELCPGLVGWGRYNYTATHRETGQTYHVRAE